MLPGGGSPLRGNLEAAAKMLQHAKPDQLVELVLPYLWVSIADGNPANVCVDACQTLRNAYGQLGVRAELQPVDLVIQDRNGNRVRYGVVHGTVPAPVFSHQRQVHRRLHRPVRTQQRVHQLEQFIPACGQAVE